MILTQPQFLYLVLILPALFGITLVGEGINKVVHQEMSGLVSLFFGALFIIIVVMSFLFFSSYTASQGL